MKTTQNTPASVSPIKRAFGKRQSGFSLNEILVSVAIMGSVAAVAAPYFADMSTAGDQSTVDAAASQVMALINNTKEGNNTLYTDVDTLAKTAGVDITKAVPSVSGATITFTMGAATASITQYQSPVGAVEDVYATF